MSANDVLDRLADEQRRQRDWQALVVTRHDQVESDVKRLIVDMVELRKGIYSAVLSLSADVGHIERSLADYRLGESLERARGQESRITYEQTLTNQLGSLEKRIAAQLTASADSVVRLRWIRFIAIGMGLLVLVVALGFALVLMGR